MSKYYYYGIMNYYGTTGRSLEIMNRILDEGIQVIDRDPGLFKDKDKPHIFLYHKNDDYDYSRLFATVKSVRCKGIDNGCVIVISPNIHARQATKRETDLVDEWRCYSNITPDSFVGIALPWESINEALDDEKYPKEDRERISKYFSVIYSKAIDRGLFIYDSDYRGFLDKIEEKEKDKQKRIE